MDFNKPIDLREIQTIAFEIEDSNLSTLAKNRAVMIVRDVVNILQRIVSMQTRTEKLLSEYPALKKYMYKLPIKL